MCFGSYLFAIQLIFQGIQNSDNYLYCTPDQIVKSKMIIEADNKKKGDLPDVKTKKEKDDTPDDDKETETTTEQEESTDKSEEIEGKDQDANLEEKPGEKPEPSEEHIPTEEETTTLNEMFASSSTLMAVRAPVGSVLHVPHPSEGMLEGQKQYHLYISNQPDLDNEKSIDFTVPVTKKRKVTKASRKKEALAQRTSYERLIHVYLLPTSYDKKEKKLKSSGTRLLPDAPLLTGKHPLGTLFELPQDGHSWDFTPCLASDEGVSDFFVSDLYD